LAGVSIMSDPLSYGFLKLLLAALVIAAACADQTAGEPRTEKRQATPAVPVVVATVTQKTMPVQLSAIGAVQAYSTVTIKA
jgi:multidrug efflux system membrane fusion protein